MRCLIETVSSSSSSFSHNYQKNNPIPNWIVLKERKMNRIKPVRQNAKNYDNAKCDCAWNSKLCMKLFWKEKRKGSASFRRFIGRAAKCTSSWQIICRIFYGFFFFDNSRRVLFVRKNGQNEWEFRIACVFTSLCSCHIISFTHCDMKI